MDPEDKIKQLQAYLHDLAEGLQAASYFVEILQSGSQQPIDATLVEKAAQQLRRAQDGFRHLRDQLADG